MFLTIEHLEIDCGGLSFRLMRSMDWVRYWALLTNTNITYNDNLNGIDNPLSLSEQWRDDDESSHLQD